ncbi:hypothetical protein RUM44_005976 [Polyplax serrata]|uniref:Uncharacterized protein n=1 Tax=Polyplax serrata TaxID=468196 RepID=A0ABR1AYM1_POLSC
MEPKIIKEEVPDLKDGNDMTPPPSSDSVPTTRRPKGIDAKFQTQCFCLVFSPPKRIPHPKSHPEKEIGENVRRGKPHENFRDEGNGKPERIVERSGESAMWKKQGPGRGVASQKKIIIFLLAHMHIFPCNAFPYGS